MVFGRHYRKILYNNRTKRQIQNEIKPYLCALKQ